jgi:hypothetical protein
MAAGMAVSAPTRKGFMRRFRKVLLCLLAALLLPWHVTAGGWPKIEAALQAWQGPKQVLLCSSLADPLMSPLVQELLEELLEAGFVVVAGSPDAVAEAGLVIDVRSAESMEVLALRRAADGAIIAFERNCKQVAQPAEPAAATAVRAPGSAPAAVTPPLAAFYPAPAPVVGAVSRPAAPLYGPLVLAGRPRSLALLAGGGGGGLELALLYDRQLLHCRLEEAGLVTVNKLTPSFTASRALHLDAADLDGDGTRELAVVWAEDVQGIYQGTDSQPHGMLLAADLQPAAPEQVGYIRLSGKQAVLQRRGPHVPFAGPVVPLTLQDGAWQLGGAELSWGGPIFACTPLDERSALGYDERGRLLLLERRAGRALPGGLLLDDLGSFAGPQIAVRLEHPQYRSGFSKEGIVREEYHALPPRLTVTADGVAYTVRRGRSAGLALLGKSSGQDRVVRIVRRGGQLLLEQPFAGVDAYILDFALLERPGRKPAAILLLNDREDGEGRAHLLIQESI